MSLSFLNSVYLTFRMFDFSPITASDARTNLYDLIKSAGHGLRGYEISLRGSKPVVLMSKEEFESWQETLDILQNKDEAATIRKARREKKTISHTTMLRKLKLDHDD